VRGAAADSVIADPAEMVDPAGRRAVLLVTDGLGPLWETGAAQCALELWGRTGPTALVYRLTALRWAETAAAPGRAPLSALRRRATNRERTVAVPAEWRSPLDPLPEGWQLPVPVLELKADWLGWWARLVADERRQVAADALLVGGTPVTEVPGPGDAPHEN